MRATGESWLVDEPVTVPKTVIPNFRDLGGIPTVDGRQVAPGRLFRSGAPHDTDHDAWRWISELGIRLVCDLRSPAERGEPPCPGGPERPRILAVAMLPDERTSGVEVMRRISSDPSGRAAGELLAENYALMPASFDPGLRSLVTSIVDDRGVPVLITCREGKDRTGFACSLLLLALGVDPDEVLAEYLRSDANFDRDAVSAAVSAHLGDDAPRLTDAVIEALRVRETYLAGALRAIDERYGSIEQYLETVGGIDEQRREQLRNLFLEPRGGRRG